MPESRDQFRERIGKVARHPDHFRDDREWADLEPTLKGIFVAQAEAVYAEALRDVQQAFENASWYTPMNVVAELAAERGIDLENE